MKSLVLHLTPAQLKKSRKVIFELLAQGYQITVTR